MRKDSPSPIRPLLRLDEARHRVGRRVSRVILGRQADQDITDGARLPANANALQRALAPEFQVGTNRLPLAARRRLVYRETVLAGRRDGHRGEIVMVAGDTLRLLHEFRIRSL